MSYSSPTTTHATIVEAITQALHDCVLDGGSGINVCRGAAKACFNPRPPCKQCYRVWMGDLRSAEQIVRDMERGDG